MNSRPTDHEEAVAAEPAKEGKRQQTQVRIGVPVLLDESTGDHGLSFLPQVYSSVEDAEKAIKEFRYPPEDGAVTASYVIVRLYRTIVVKQEIVSTLTSDTDFKFLPSEVASE